jgi:hypothetical protein
MGTRKAARGSPKPLGTNTSTDNPVFQVSPEGYVTVVTPLLRLSINYTHSGKLAVMAFMGKYAINQ